MTRIDDLILELAPDGVEYRALGEVGELIRGRRFTKADYVDVGLESIHYGEIYTTYGLSATETVSHVRPELRSRLRLAEPGDLVIAATGENAEDLCKAVAWLGSGPVAVHDDCYILRHQLEPKFASYCFQTESFQKQKATYVSEAKVSRVSGRDLAQIRIPVAPIGVQREIVGILDTFAELEAELEAESEARRRQYGFYRDDLLRFSGRQDVRWVPMGEAGAFIRGRRFTKADYVDEGIPCIHYGEVYTEFGVKTRKAVSSVRSELRGTLRFAEPGDLVLVDVGETVDDVGKAVAWLGDDPVAIHDHCYAFRHDMDPTFVSYYFQTSMFRSAKAQHVARTKVKTLLINGLERVLIPVPSLAEQQRIVACLDAFDALLSDISAGLPAELVARRKQYEYYRDKLLTFEEAV